MNILPHEWEVLDVIRPLKEEHNNIWSIAEKLVDAVDASGKAKGMVVGSIARDTWISGDRDLDIFMMFAPSLSREELESEGISLARDISGLFNGVLREKYAEHPYINTSIFGLDVDLVPCYAVPDAVNIKSAVDRTPFHTRYIRARIGNLVDDVLLLKQFLKSGGIYGSDHMTEGFAGYLCELLILYYGSFKQLVGAAADWHPGLVIDIEEHGGKEFDDPLVVIDPVDPRRNVAASLSLTKMSEFIEYCGGYIRLPSIDFFLLGGCNHSVTAGAGVSVDHLLQRKTVAFGRDDFVKSVIERGTGIYAIIIPTPDDVPDIVVPQLRRSTNGIVSLIERNEFVVNRADVFMGDEHCMLLFELFVDLLPPVKRHMGPPVWNHVNASRFAGKYLSSETFSGPFIDGSQYYVEIPRKFTSAGDLLSSKDLMGARLGKDVERAFKDGWTLLKGEDCWDEEFSLFLRNFFDKRSPLMGILQDLDTISE